MRAIADGRLEASRVFGEEMYYCLGCLACTSACPAGVNYAELFEQARAEVERCRLLDSPLRRMIRHFSIKWLFMDLARLRFLGRVLRLYQTLRLQSLVRRSRVLQLFPKRLRELEAMTPTIQPRFSGELIPELLPATSPRRFKVVLLAGCAQDLIFSDVNRDTAEVLAANGCDVVCPRKQNCCGSLHAHNGEIELARSLARQNIDQFPPEQYDAIITNAGGCGSHLKHYRALLAEDPHYAERAREWDKKVKDVHEWLVQKGLRPVKTSDGPPLVVTYHESCHLAHGQKITREPRELLQAIPRLRLIELPESTWCCGSAGVYNLTQPEMSNTLLERKLKHIQSVGASILATANPGCQLQLLNAAKARNLPLRVVHPITLLAEAYRGAMATH